MKNYYKILGISKDASSNEIRKAYRKKALKVHPDTKINEDDYQIKELNEAYNALKNRNELFDINDGVLNEEFNTFYDNLDYYYPKSFYENWKGDQNYRRIMVYLWILFGIIAAFILLMGLYLYPLKSLTKMNFNLNKPKEEANPELQINDNGSDYKILEI